MRKEAAKSQSLSESLTDCFRVLARPLSKLLALLKVPPNLITLGGALFHVTVAYGIARGRFGPFLTGSLILVGGFFDVVDGAVAKLSGKVSPFGEFLDSVLDRFSDSAILLGLLLLNLSHGNSWEVVLLAVALGSFPLVSYARTKAENLGYECKVGIMNRTVRVIILGISLWVNRLAPALVILNAGSLLTVGRRIYHVWRLSKTSLEKADVKEDSRGHKDKAVEPIENSA
jgi:phosphatidylinositol phosphate synthase